MSKKPGATRHPWRRAPGRRRVFGRSRRSLPSATRTSAACAGPAGPVDHRAALDHVLAGHASPWVVAARRAQELDLVTRAPGRCPVRRSPSSSRPRGRRETRRSRSGHRRATPRQADLPRGRASATAATIERPRPKPGVPRARRFVRAVEAVEQLVDRRPSRAGAPVFATRIDAIRVEWPCLDVIHPPSTLCRTAFSTRFATEAFEERPVPDHDGRLERRRRGPSARVGCRLTADVRPRHGRALRDRHGSATRVCPSRSGPARASCR